MNEIFKRVSVRQFSDEEVTDIDVKKLLEAGMSAPSSKNVRPWEFFVVRNKQLLEALSKAAPNAAPCKNADIAIVVCGNNSLELNDYMDINLSASTQNILLEATSLGLGAVWLGIRPKNERVVKVNELLNLPKNLSAFSLIAIGHKKNESKMKNRFDESKIHYVL